MSRHHRRALTLQSVRLRLQRPLRTLITKDAPPAFLAFAVPRLFTGTMFADWMGFTHVTKESLPAFSAPVYTFNNKTISSTKPCWCIEKTTNTDIFTIK